MRPMLKGFGVALVALTVGAAGARADLVEILQPGSRAALGLGGDPFLSPLADESGWWLDAGLASGRMRGMRADLSAPVAIRPGSGEELFASRFGARAVEEWRGAGSVVRVSGTLEEPRWDAGVSTSAGDVAVRGGASRLMGGLRAERGSGGVVLQATGPLWGETDAARHEAWGVGARLRRASLGAAQVSWTREETPDVLRSDIRGEPVAAGLNLGVERITGDAALRARSWLKFEGGLERLRYLPIEPRGRALDYAIEPVANGTGYEVGARSGRFGGWEVLARVTASALDLSADASWGGQRFGRLNRGRFEQRSWLAAAEWKTGRSRLLAEFESATIQVAGRATVESWPFTSTLVDLLGIRRFFQLKGSMAWSRLHLGSERAFSPAWGARAGVTWFDLWPEARLMSWQPTFLVFGVTDLRQDILDAPRVQLAALSLGATWRVGMIESSLDLRQFAYAKRYSAARPAATDAGGRGGTSGAGAGNSPRARWPGGTALMAALTRRF